jgi:hypothetical protein
MAFVAQPELATGSDTAPYAHSLPVERVPGIVNRDGLSLLGGM